jgi:peptide chain release factor 2
MRAEAEAHVDQINAALALLRRSLDWDRALRRLDELNARVEDPTLWDNPKAAQEVMRERTRLDTSINATRSIEQEMTDTAELIELAEAEGDDDLANEGVASLAALAERADKDKVTALLSGEADGNDTYLEVHAGAGGTESQDWAEMLLRMYQRWAEKRGCKIEMIEYQAGEQAGIKSATLLIKGENAYGYAKTESGVHRLVRISPYDSSARRHTSFSSVWVYPVIDDDIDIEIKESDRSQHKNRATAMGMLKARLYEAELRKREEAANTDYQAKTEIGWGHQIRSYVLQPYQLVKDLRTGVTSTSPDDVLDGALDPFMAAALAQKVTGEKVDVEDVD